MLSQRRKNYLIGGISLISILILIWGFNYLKGKSFITGYNTYHVRYENTNGITESAFVTLHGYKVGYVKKVSLNLQHSSKIKVEISVDKKVKLPVGTVARITSLDIMGTKVIELVVTRETFYHKNGDLLVSDSEEGLKDQISVQLQPLKIKLENLIQEINESLLIIRSVLDPDAQNNLKNVIATLNSTFIHLNRVARNLDNITTEQEDNINTAVENFSSITGTLSKSDTDIKDIISNLATLTKMLSDTSSVGMLSNINQSVSSLGSIVKKIEDGEGTLGKLSSSDSLYYSLQALIKDLDALSVDIKAHPKRYINVSVFGRDKRE